MAKKNITIDDLAKMIKDGFDNTVTLIQFERLEKDVQGIKKDIREIKTDLKETIKRTDKLEMRVDYVENVLDVPAKK